MLTTKEASSILEAAGIKLKPEQVAELAKSQVFPNAYKDKESGRWIIPAEDVAAFVRLHRRKERTRWITAGTITFIITLLGLLSIAKDTADLVTAYIFPIPSATPTATSTPSPLTCTVISADRTWLVRDFPAQLPGESIPFIPQGTIVTIDGPVRSGGVDFYKISHFSYDSGEELRINLTYESDSPAVQAGLQTGDIILQMNEMKITSTVEAVEYLYSNTGKNITFHILRNGQQLTKSVYARTKAEWRCWDWECFEGPIGVEFEGGYGDADTEAYVYASTVSCETN